VTDGAAAAFYIVTLLQVGFRCHAHSPDDLSITADIISDDGSLHISLPYINVINAITLLRILRSLYAPEKNGSLTFENGQSAIALEPVTHRIKKLRRNFRHNFSIVWPV
jgi:hypothetical protein